MVEFCRRFRFAMESGIRAGVLRGEFVPYYEKQVDLQSGELTGFEMLARWNSPKFGIVSPEIFIPIAEEIGAIAKPDTIRFTDALPKTRSGKIMRRLLRSIASGEANTTQDTTPSKAASTPVMTP